MDYIIYGTIITIPLLVLLGLLFVKGKSISSSKNFPTPKDEPDRKENDE